VQCVLSGHLQQYEAAQLHLLTAAPRL
jgi:hypothetical protein